MLNESSRASEAAHLPWNPGYPLAALARARGSWLLLSAAVLLVAFTPSQRLPGAAFQEAGKPPEVTSVNPPRATRGSELLLKVKGKNFAKGAKLSFSNPGIRVLETKVDKSSELAVSIQVDSNATVGVTSLFVVNPDDSETEASFEITAGAPVQPAPPRAPEARAPNPEPPPSVAASATAQQFEVFNLGEVAGILQNQEKAAGTLTLVGKKLKYEEGGKEIFRASRGEIKEISANSFLGVNTGTFHIILNSGKRYNFIAHSLLPADGEAIIDALRHALL